MKTRRDVLRGAIATTAAAALPQGMWSAEAIGRPVTPNGQKAARDRIRRGLEQKETTGLALSVVSGSGIVWEEGFGFADRANGVKATAHSAFHLQSCTKPFSTTLVTTFAAEGKLSLDAPANQYLRADPLIAGNGNPEKVSVRLLGAHASGLPSTYLELYGGQPSPTWASVLERFGRLAYPPATIWEYSNIGFEALGAILASISPKDYGSLMQDRVLTPLGLRDSFWDTDKTRLPEAVVRYEADGTPIPYYVTTTPPSGELFASAHDISRFAMWNMKMALGGGSGLMTEHWLDEIHKPVFRAPNGTTTNFGWAMGRLSSGVNVIHKGGGGSGVSTMIVMIPERKLACTVLANHARAESLTHAVCDLIMTSYLSEWKMPDEGGNPPRQPYAFRSPFTGHWRGTIRNDGIEVAINISFHSDREVILTIEGNAPETLSDIANEGEAFIGLFDKGVIHSPEALQIGAKGGQLKLITNGDALVGRIYAVVSSSGKLRGAIPFVLNLTRADA